MIREGLPADLPAMTAVRTSVRENHMSVEQMRARGITPEKTLADMASGELGCWVAEQHGQIVAFAMADRRGGRLWALFTHLGHEGRGHGTALLDRAENWLRQQSLARAELDTARNSTAHRFYLRRGWREITGKADDPEDVVLEKALASTR